MRYAIALTTMVCADTERGTGMFPFGARKLATGRASGWDKKVAGLPEMVAERTSPVD